MHGYIMDFEGHQYAPEGKVEPPVTDVKLHNAVLDAQTIGAMMDGQDVILYLTKDNLGRYVVGTWAGTHKMQVQEYRHSWHNMAGKDGRADVWFYGPDGLLWHGVNIGDNEICRCHRLKKR